MNGRIEADLGGKVALVTGATAGIGLEVAGDLAVLGAEVILSCRSREKGEAARREVARRAPQAVTRLMVVELSSQDSIRDACALLLRETPRLDVLCNNAGCWLIQNLFAVFFDVGADHQFVPIVCNFGQTPRCVSNRFYA